MRRPNVPVAIVALVTVQVVMVLIMTMTPLHMTAHDHDLAAVGLVISGHTFGMFGLSPISGRLTDRYGSVPVILAGLALTAFSSVLAAVAPPDGGVVLFIALFLLGYGWNLGYVAGSALLTRDLSLAERTRLQGLTDSLIWSSAAVASLGSGIVVAGVELRHARTAGRGPGHRPDAAGHRPPRIRRATADDPVAVAPAVTGDDPAVDRVVPSEPARTGSG